MNGQLGAQTHETLTVFRFLFLGKAFLVDKYTNVTRDTLHANSIQFAEIIPQQQSK
jgi:hypothetical protein